MLLQAQSGSMTSHSSNGRLQKHVHSAPNVDSTIVFFFFMQVGDLGLGRLLSENTMEAHSKVGTPLYMSPEVRDHCCMYRFLYYWCDQSASAPFGHSTSHTLFLRSRSRCFPAQVLRGKGYEWSSDTWSLGCILYELAMLRSPFKEEGLNLYGLFQKIIAGQYPPISDVYSPELRNLVDSMLRQEPGDRPELHEVVTAAQQMRDATTKAREAQRNGSAGPNRTASSTASGDTANSGNNTPMAAGAPQPDASSAAPHRQQQQHQPQQQPPLRQLDIPTPTAVHSNAASHLPIDTGRPLPSQRNSSGAGLGSDAGGQQPRQAVGQHRPAFFPSDLQSPEAAGQRPAAAPTSASTPGHPLPVPQQHQQSGVGGSPAGRRIQFTGTSTSMSSTAMMPAPTSSPSAAGGMANELLRYSPLAIDNLLPEPSVPAMSTASRDRQFPFASQQQHQPFQQQTSYNASNNYGMGANLLKQSPPTPSSNFPSLIPDQGHNRDAQPAAASPPVRAHVTLHHREAVQQERPSTSTAQQRFTMMMMETLPPSAVDRGNNSTIGSEPPPMEAVAAAVAQYKQLLPPDEIADLCETSPAEASAFVYDRLMLMGFMSSAGAGSGAASRHTSRRASSIAGGPQHDDEDDDEHHLRDPALRRILHRTCFAFPAIAQRNNGYGGSHNSSFMQFRLFVILVRWLSFRALGLVVDEPRRHDFEAGIESMFMDYLHDISAPLAIANTILQLLALHFPGASSALAGVTATTLTTGFGAGALKVLCYLTDAAMRGSGSTLASIELIAAMQHRQERDGDDGEGVHEDIEEVEWSTDGNDDGIDDGTAAGTARAAARGVSNDDDDEDEEAVLQEQKKPAVSLHSSRATAAESKLADDEDHTVPSHHHAPGVAPEVWSREFEAVKSRLSLFDKQLQARAEGRETITSPYSTGLGGASLPGPTAVSGAASNWRSHLAVMQRHNVLFKGPSSSSTGATTAASAAHPTLSLDSISLILQGVAGDLGDVLIAIASAERKWNTGSVAAGPAAAPAGPLVIGSGVPAMVAEHRSLHEALVSLREKLSTSRASLSSATAALDAITNECEELADGVSVRSESMTSTSRLQDIRAALMNLRRESASLHIQAGMLQRALLRKQYEDCSSQRETAKVVSTALSPRSRIEGAGATGASNSDGDDER